MLGILTEGENCNCSDKNVSRCNSRTRNTRASRASQLQQLQTARRDWAIRTLGAAQAEANARLLRPSLNILCGCGWSVFSTAKEGGEGKERIRVAVRVMMSKDCVGSREVSLSSLLEMTLAQSFLGSAVFWQLQEAGMSEPMGRAHLWILTPARCISRQLARSVNANLKSHL